MRSGSGALRSAREGGRRLWGRFAARDRDLAVTRRGARTAVVMPAMFALSSQVIGNKTMATFAAFGSFSMLLLVDFTGPMRDRLRAQAALGATGAVLICLATAVSRVTWLAALTMAVVGFAVLFSGVVSSVLAGATTSLLLGFILPVAIPAPMTVLPDRLAGWGLAAAASLVAVALLWPAPARDALGGVAATASRALAAQLRAEVAGVRGATGPSGAEGGASPSGAEEEASQRREAAAAVAALHQVFIATPYRPTGLTTGARALVRLVDELTWLAAVVDRGAVGRGPAGAPPTPAAWAVRTEVAAVLERGADLLDVPQGDPAPLRSALGGLRTALDAMEAEAVSGLPAHGSGASSRRGASGNGRVSALVTAFEPSFRAQEMSFAVAQIAANIDLAAAAERRGWLDRLLGRAPRGLPERPGGLAAARIRAAGHVRRNSVWLHNSVRGAIGLAVAVAVADATSVQHAFWVVLGTLSVLRSSALNTGQSVLRGLLGTVVGSVLGGLLLVLLGTDTALLWFLLPVAVLLAGVTPSVVSFTAGQAAFTLTLVILFNIVQPAGWRLGLVRVEDIGIGCAVSLLVGLFFWPRGAASAMGKALGEAYGESSAYLTAAVQFAAGRCSASSEVPVPPSAAAGRAAAAARRLDDAFRGYLAEHGAKPVPLADMTTLVNGVVGLRLAADAVLALWQRAEDQPAADRTAARVELLAGARIVSHWFEALAASLEGGRTAPEPLARDDDAERRLIETVRRDLSAGGGENTAAAVRVIWTGDHLAATRRLQPALSTAAQAATRPAAHA